MGGAEETRDAADEVAGSFEMVAWWEVVWVTAGEAVVLHGRSGGLVAGLGSCPVGEDVGGIDESRGLKSAICVFTFGKGHDGAELTTCRMEEVEDLWNQLAMTVGSRPKTSHRSKSGVLALGQSFLTCPALFRIPLPLEQLRVERESPEARDTPGSVHHTRSKTLAYRW